MTTNALGNDEWVGVDDIAMTGTPWPEKIEEAIYGGLSRADRFSRCG